MLPTQPLHTHTLDGAQPSHNKRASWAAAVLGCFFLLLVLGALWLRATTIGADGTSTEGRATAFLVDSLEVYAYPGNAGPLQTGDRILAINGVPMTEWARRLFAPGGERPAFAPGERAVYRILRNGQPLTLQVELQRQSLQSFIQARWGFLLFVMISQLLAAWLLVRRPYIPAARVFFVWAMLGAQIYLWALPLRAGDIVSGYGFWLGRFMVAGMAVLFYPALVHFALLYPRPSSAIRRHRWLLPALYGGSAVLCLAMAGYFYLTAPSVLAGLAATIRAVYVIAVILLLSALAILILQYRRSRPGAERQRAQWALFGGMVAVAAGLLVGIIMPLLIGHTGLDINVYGLILLAFPVSMTIAMWRYHLFDVDVIIRRTLLYTILTTILGAAYIVAIIFLEAFLGQFTGQSSRPAVALATAAILILFSPVRRRVQQALDRLFYRTNYDATLLLARFARTCRDEADLPKILSELESIIGSSLQPASINIWLAPRRQLEEAEQE